ncbi:CO/xanthine dehydrogenase Mo-binding subunit [Ensifer mexicanus]|nr:CO/xanthine dehydrogenase Mo-binding subunit [Sinorhizobium mexicanum]
MRFDKPATMNPIDQLKVVGQPIHRVDGPLKTTGRAVYAYEWHDPNIRYAYGYVVGSAIAKGKIKSIDITAARRAPGVIAVVTSDGVGELKKGKYNTAKLFGGREIQHYHQAIAVVVAETFEEARAAATLVKVDYIEEKGAFDLAAEKDAAVKPEEGGSDSAAGDFDAAFEAAPVKLDQVYTTPDQSHAMMEPHASIAAWNGEGLTVWTSSQMIDWWRTDLATTPRDRQREGPCHVAICWRRLWSQALPPRRRGARGACRARSQAPGESRPPSSISDEQHHASPGDDPEDPHRRRA